MARKAREVSSTGMYAVTVKTNAAVFAGEEVRELFKDCFERFLGDGAKAVLFYDSRVDMLISETERGISADMKSIMTSFSRGCNKLMNTTGKIFAGRFGSVPVEDPETEKKCIAYLSGEGDVPEVFGGKEHPDEHKKAEQPAITEDESGKADEETETANEPEEQQTYGPKRWHDDIPVWML